METVVPPSTTPDPIASKSDADSSLVCPSCGEPGMRWQDLTWRTGGWRRWGVVLLVLGALLFLISGPAFLISESAENSPVRPARTIADEDAAHAEQDVPPGTISGRSADPNPRNQASPQKLGAFTGIVAGGLCVFTGAVLCIGRRRLICPICGFKTSAATREVGKANHRS